MRKTIAFLATCLSASALTLTANAQTPDAVNTPSNLAGEIIAVAAVIIVVAFVAYAGFKIVKKWSRQSD